MSATTPNAAEIAAQYGARLDLAAQLAQIERMQAETRKFAAEQNKLAEEASKLGAEALKLAAEQMKLQRDRSLSPWLAMGAAAGGVVTVATLLLRALGVLQ
ncbi:hypothetical protein NON00_04760 [Roseomonas sp. GC11]|uniref:hypothetical protein n=1 Tax=Roseomonas sp. GC11 TaxID=2950546 RepID=UPI00210C7A4E|nr:hypothetical protein [Roseomonas sp. GC11]MCQ4159233.1 hypothetical protein [Roseomonas sp. GC11]